MSITIKSPGLCTKLEVWQPKYDDTSLTREYGEPVALLHLGKVRHATPVILVEFTRAKHLAGLRFAIRRTDALRHAIGSNGRAPMLEVPLSHFEPWETNNEILNKVKELWP